MAAAHTTGLDPPALRENEPLPLSSPKWPLGGIRGWLIIPSQASVETASLLHRETSILFSAGGWPPLLLYLRPFPLSHTLPRPCVGVHALKLGVLGLFTGLLKVKIVPCPCLPAPNTCEGREEISQFRGSGPGLSQPPSQNHPGLVWDLPI